MKYIIRQETPQDYDAVYRLVTRAFAGAEHTDGDEQNLVVRLRQDPGYDPRLSLVAEQDDILVGHILFTPAQVGENTQLCLAPLSVLPEFQGKGVGGALIRAGHCLAAGLGYHLSLLVGHPTYYPRFGYVPAGRLGILPPFEVPQECFMACDLTGNGIHMEGTLRLAPGFGMG